MTFDQAQSPRLGQRVAPERPGVLFVLSSAMPEAPYMGLLVFVVDTAEFQIYDGEAWISPSGGGGEEAPTFVTTATPTADTTGQLWYHPVSAVLKVWNGTLWAEVHDSGMATVTSNANLALSTANSATTTANTASSTASTALAAATAASATNAVTTTQLAPTAITSKHTLTNPTIAGATVSGAVNMGNQVITNAASIAVTALTITTGNTFINAPEMRPFECYVRNVPVATGGSAVFMGSSGRLFIHTSAKKYKKNIKDFDVEADPWHILELRPVTYDLRKNVLDEEAETDGTGEIGFIADEAADLGLEPLVGRNEDGGVETFHYYKLPIYHQHLLRAQQEEIRSLRADVEMLKAALTGQGD